MSLFSRIKTLFVASANSALDELENTKSLSNQLLRDIDEKVSQARSALINVVARRELAEDDFDRARLQQASWEEALLKAENHADKTLMERAATQYEAACTLVESRRALLEEITQAAADLQAEVDELTQSRNETANTIQVLQAQEEVAKAQQTVSDATDSFDISAQKNTLSTLQARVRDRQATVRAARSVREHAKGEDILAELNATPKKSAEDILADIKARRAQKATA